jgi:hypothetical protein
MGLHSNCQLIALPTNNRLGWKGLPGANTLADYKNSWLMAVKSFMTLAVLMSVLSMRLQRSTYYDISYERITLYNNWRPWQWRVSGWNNNTQHWVQLRWALRHPSAKTTGGRKPTHLTSANICINILNTYINAISIVPWGERYRCPYKKYRC